MPIVRWRKYIDFNTPIKLIEERGYRDLYKKYDNGLIENVVGKDIKFDQPYNSDYVINNIKSKKIFIEEGTKIVNSLLVNLKWITNIFMKTLLKIDSFICTQTKMARSLLRLIKKV